MKKYSKVLSQYYPIWFRDCYDSVIYCMKRDDTVRAESYREDAKAYFDIINENWEEINTKWHENYYKH